MRHVTLEIPLCALPLSGRGQRDDACDTRVEVLGDPFYGAPLAGGITSLEDDNDSCAFRAHPLLQHDQLRLQPEQLALVDRARQPPVTVLGDLFRLASLSDQCHLLQTPDLRCGCHLARA